MTKNDNDVFQLLTLSLKDRTFIHFVLQSHTFTKLQMLLSVSLFFSHFFLGFYCGARITKRIFGLNSILTSDVLVLVLKMKHLVWCYPDSVMAQNCCILFHAKAQLSSITSGGLFKIAMQVFFLFFVFVLLLSLQLMLVCVSQQQLSA